jgi:hypothetical protein
LRVLIARAMRAMLAAGSTKTMAGRSIGSSVCEARGDSTATSASAMATIVRMGATIFASLRSVVFVLALRAMRNSAATETP